MTFEEYAESRGHRVVTTPEPTVDGDIMDRTFLVRTDGGYAVVLGPINESSQRWPEAWKHWCDLLDADWERRRGPDT